MMGFGRGSFGRRAVLIAGALCSSSAAAHAATSLYWPGDDDGYGRPIYETPHDQPRRIKRQPRMPKDEAAKAEQLAKNASKPTGPLVIAISLERQSMKVYDANGFFAESPISSGTKGHTTPMGVFSVIQKNKWHRSNLYSDAPMPFMQRLTWSGIALHAGVVPGYPASHGCVRMPMTFAVKMWSWTRMGARVVIAPGEIAPAAISHPFLASIKRSDAPVPPPVANMANTKTADAGNAVASATASDSPAVPAASDAKAATASDNAVTEKPVLADKPPAQKRSGPIAIFISRKDAKLYVRQNFEPLFDVPMTISGDQPLGTHVFTAYADTDKTKPLRWTSLSLPATAAMAHDPTLSRRRTPGTTPAAITPMVEPGAVEALNRLQLPDDVLSRLGDNLTSGSSLIVADQGIAASGETGAGTDFIVRLR